MIASTSTPEENRIPTLQDVETQHILRVLEIARGNQRRAARTLGISRWSLARRLKKYGLSLSAAPQRP